MGSGRSDGKRWVQRGCETKWEKCSREKRKREGRVKVRRGERGRENVLCRYFTVA